MSDRSNIAQRIVQLTREIEQTYGPGKSYTFGSVKVGGYSPREWESKERRDERWMETAREWSRIRAPLIAELQTLAELHRDAWPELYDAVERRPWEESPQPDLSEIRAVALACARDTAARELGEADQRPTQSTIRDGAPIEPTLANGVDGWRRALCWLRDHVFASVITGLLVAAILAWVGLG